MYSAAARVSSAPESGRVVMTSASVSRVFWSGYGSRSVPRGSWTVGSLELSSHASYRYPTGGRRKRLMSSRTSSPNTPPVPLPAAANGTAPVPPLNEPKVRLLERDGIAPPGTFWVTIVVHSGCAAGSVPAPELLHALPVH